MNTLQAIYFGQNHPEFNQEDWNLVKKVKRLAKQHQRQCENECNGYGTVKGQMYYGGKIDDWAKREYGQNVKSSYISDDLNIFDSEIEKIEGRIGDIITIHNRIKNQENFSPFSVELQRDPRGQTVRLFYKFDFIAF